MDTKLISLKDFEISPNENVIERSQSFQSYIDQMDQFGCKSYWVMAKTGVVAKMQIEGYDGTQLCFIVDRIGYNKASVTVLTLYTCLIRFGINYELESEKSDIHKVA